MIRIAVISGPDSMAGVVDQRLAQLKAELDVIEKAEKDIAAWKMVDPSDLPVCNKLLVQALLARCRKADPNRVVRTRDVFLVAGVPERRWYRWQAGEYVSPRVRQRCEETVNLSAEQFFARFDALTGDRRPNCDASCA